MEDQISWVHDALSHELVSFAVRMQQIRQQMLIRFSKQFQPVAVLWNRWQQRQHTRRVNIFPVAPKHLDDSNSHVCCCHHAPAAP